MPSRFAFCATLLSPLTWSQGCAKPEADNEQARERVSKKSAPKSDPAAQSKPKREPRSLRLTT